MNALPEEVVGRLFGVIYGMLKNLKLVDARAVVAKAGIVGFDAPAQLWHPFLAGVQTAFNEMSPEARNRAVHILARDFSAVDEVRALFELHGYEFISGSFVPVAELDKRESLYLPPSSASELARATQRLVSGDDSGAITSACGAVDTLMQHIYSKHSLGDPGQFSFSAKVNTAANRLNVFGDMEADFLSLRMKAEDAKSLVSDMKQGLNHAAQMLQTLRRTMGDVHGSKPALRRTAYDAIKWASAICGLFEGR